MLVAAIATGQTACSSPRTSISRNAPPTRKTNVVIILTDDQGYNSLSCAGAKDFKTPHLDRLAAEGVRLTQAYSSSPVCSPTRASLMTGNYPQHSGRLFDWVLGPLGADHGLPTDGPSLPRMLKTGGYATGVMGKWHLGGIKQYWPMIHGFDEWKGFCGGNLDYWRHDDHPHQPDLWNGEQPLKAEGYLTDLITDWSIDFIDRHQERPFFLYVAYNAPHWPYQGYEPDLRNIDRQRKEDPVSWQLGGGTPEIYRSMMERMDHGIGRILDALAAHGLEKDTLVIFTSDNGGDPPFANNEPLRGHKTQLFEGGIRVPCIFRWPGRLPAGAVCDQPIITMDLTASTLATAGVPRDPTVRPADGINVLPILAGQAPPQPRRFFWFAKDRPPVQPFLRAIRDGDWKLLQTNQEQHLFNLKDDPSEQNDLAAVQTAKVVELARIYAEWEATLPAQVAGSRIRVHPETGVAPRHGPPSPGFAGLRPGE